MVWDVGPRIEEWPALNEKLRELSTNLRYINNYQTFTPVWTGATTDPAIGNGTITGELMEIQERRHISVRIAMGSTTTFGSGGWSFALPSEISKPAVGYWHGTAYGIDSGTANRVGAVVMDNGSETMLCVTDGASARWAPTVPHTWATNDELRFTLTYRIALDP